MKYDDVKPVVCKAVRVWLADGTRMLGMWTGAKLWSTKGEISLVKWELEVKQKKTGKLLKALRAQKKAGLDARPRFCAISPRSLQYWDL